jgi:hypothetical protein
MKKYVLKVLVTLSLSLILSLSVYAETPRSEIKKTEIFFKLGYGFPTNDNNFYENAISFGANVNLGVLWFKPFQFKPGFDVFQLSTEESGKGVLLSVHPDWYFYQNINANKFLGFLGFAPTVNFYVNELDNNKNYTSIGVDLFGGLEFWFQDNIAVMVELRESITDILSFNKNITKIYLGCNYKF